MKIRIEILFFLSILIYSCKKTEVNTDLTSQSQNENLRISTKDSTLQDANIDFNMLVSPVRDILKYNSKYFTTVKNTESVVTKSGIIVGDNFQCCNGICLTVPTNPTPFNYLHHDAFGNGIQYIGQYGPASRNIYYVSLPENVNSNSPIVLMIHGGGWFSGPDGSLYGFPFNWGSQDTVSIVKDLLHQGFVVVSMLYRLSQLGNNHTEFISNQVSWQDQIDDIELAVNHIRANFPTCLYGRSLNANNIHLLGESAGGHLALMYAYTHPNLNYIRSVLSMYAPTNLQTYGNWIKNIPANSIFNCTTPPSAFTTFSSTLTLECGLHLSLVPKHSPFNWPVDYYQPMVDNNVFTNNCKTSNLDVNGEDYHIYKGFNLLQSPALNTINNPSSDQTLFQYSPVYTTNVGAYPTFIMHGKEDVIVPYNQSTVNFETALSNAGGVLIQDFVVLAAMPTSYTQPHLIRKYCKANHGWLANNQNDQKTIRDKVRADVLHWFSNH